MVQLMQNAPSILTAGVGYTTTAVINRNGWYNNKINLKCIFDLMFDCQVMSSARKLSNAILSVFNWMETHANDFMTKRTAPAIDEKTKLNFFLELQSLAESQDSRIDRLIISHPARQKLISTDYRMCDDVIRCMMGYVILISLNKNCDYIKAVAANYRQMSKEVHKAKTAGASTAESSKPFVETASSSTASSNLPPPPLPLPPPPPMSSDQSDICQKAQGIIFQNASLACEFLNAALGPNREYTWSCVYKSKQYRVIMRLAVKDCAIMIWFVVWSWRGTGNATSHYPRDCRRVRASQSAVSVLTCVWIFSTAASHGTVDVLKWTPWSGSCGRLTMSSGSPETVRKSPCRAAKWPSRPGYADQWARERRTVFRGILSVYFFKCLGNYCGLSAHL